MQAAEHDNQVVADGYVLSQVHVAEEVHHVVADCGIIFGPNGAEENYNIVPRLMGDVHIAEENHYVMVDVSFGVNAAEEADRVVYGLALGNH